MTKTLELQGAALIVQRITRRRVRNFGWREDAEQEAMLKVVKALRKTALSQPLVSTIAINACNDVFRSHRRDPLSYAVVPEPYNRHVIPDAPFLVDLDAWLLQCGDVKERLLRYVINGGRFNNFNDLGIRFGVSKATVSRMLADLRGFLFCYSLV